jgi:hypothetical protein
MFQDLIATRGGRFMGDVRLDSRGAWFIDRIVATHSLVLKTVGGDRAGEAAINRYLGNDEVAPATILAPAIARTAKAAEGRRVVVAQDTTEVNFAGRARRRKGLGPGGDGGSPGFFIHPQIVIEADEEAVIGIAGAEIWTRDPGTTGDHRKRPAEDKESRRWLTGAQTAADAHVEVRPGTITVSSRPPRAKAAVRCVSPVAPGGRWTRGSRGPSIR